MVSHEQYWAEQERQWDEVSERIDLAEAFLPGVEDLPNMSVQESAATATAFALVAIAKALLACPLSDGRMHGRAAHEETREPDADRLPGSNGWRRNR